MENSDADSEAACIWLAVAGLAGAALAAECFVGFGLWFAPGWANQWPGGLSIDVVWPAGMTAFAAVMLMTAAVGVGASLAAGYQYWSGHSLGRSAIALWLAVTAVITVAASACWFASLRASALAMWPNGYNP
jgi:hypothetical protein